MPNNKEIAVPSSPLFLKYQKMYERNPRSRCFAPLAEIYRKMGMADKAVGILREGISFHPTYMMGHLGLASCYADLGQFQLAYATLRPIVANNRENIRLQKLFARICQELGLGREAVETYKYLLFMNPKDRESSEALAHLENATSAPVLVEEPRTTKAAVATEDLKNTPREEEVNADQWNTVDWAAQTAKNLADVKTYPTTPQGYAQMANEHIVHKGPGVLPAENLSEEEEAAAAGQINPDFSEPASKLGEADAENFIVQEADRKAKARVQQSKDKYIGLGSAEGSSAQFLATSNEQADPELPDHTVESLVKTDLQTMKAEEAARPVVTLTLVDLYCAQGHYQKALDILTKIQILNPDDPKIEEKINEVQNFLLAAKDTVLERPADKGKIADFFNHHPDSATEDEGITLKFKSKAAGKASRASLADEGRHRLMDIFQAQQAKAKGRAQKELSMADDYVQRVEKRFDLFLTTLKKHAAKYRT